MISMLKYIFNCITESELSNGKSNTAETVKQGPDKSDLQTQTKESPEGISGPTFRDCFIYDKK